MIISLRAKNFRCFQDTNTLKIAPITLLFGENNSGKSAIIQAINILTLNIKSEERELLPNLISTSRDYDYGSFEDIVFKHNINTLITLSYEFDHRFRENYKKEERVVLHLTYGYLPKRKEICLSRLIIEDKQGERIKIYRKKYSNTAKISFLRGYQGDLSYLSRLFSRYAFPALLRHAYFDFATRLSRTYGEKIGRFLYEELVEVIYILNVFSGNVRSIYHLGPLRIQAERTSLHTGSITKDVGLRGERTLQSYAALVKRGKKEDKAIINLINKALYKLGFIKKFEIHSIGLRHYEFWTQHRHSFLKANLADTGFGASQVLPVLFLLYTSPDNSMLLYEQPEIHLHPAAQAELGSLFAKACSSRKRIVIETHSENLILRIQTEIARRNLSSRDVMVYYIEPRKGGHIIKPLPLNEKGEFLEKWPKGFFEDSYRESLKLSEARLKNYHA
jgi:predicted ATPase